ncbi:S41 family peptidase [Oleispirillum naphthae]|uniref:S41 family peptidase n=1 Tax=Oleispirillum naphthae TaxID=2838853 RepID=UPI00308227AE
MTRNSMIALGLGALLLTFEAPAGAAARNDDSAYEYLNLFGDVFERVRRDYVEEVSDKQLIEAAIGGMLQSLDPHSAYLDKESYADMQVDTKGEFGGLGIEVTMEAGLVKVISPIDETPAAEAGVQAGDLITHIDHVPVLGLALTEAVDKMRGPVGTEIVITVRRGAKETFDIKLKRAVIKIKSVRARSEGEIGYLRITSFNERTDVNLRKAVKEMRAEKGKALKGFVLDLRNNPGGLLEQAVAVADDFLDHGEIVSTRARDARETERYNAAKGDLIDGMPLVVLINGGSASASEIVAGALQDQKRAILMGTKSFGKGSVQTIIPLRGHGAMKLTTARYYTPSGRSIQAVGIEPDIEVPSAKIEVLEPRRQMKEADYRNALDKKPEDAADEKPQAPETPAKPASPQDKAAEDYQLQRAFDLLKGLALYAAKPS